MTSEKHKLKEIILTITGVLLNTMLIILEIIRFAFVILIMYIATRIILDLI